MNDAPLPEVVVVGSASRDVTRDDPRGWRLGGGVTYGAMTLARLGIRTAAVVGVDAAAGAASELELLRESGVQVHLVPITSGPVFELIETPLGRLQRCHEPGTAIEPAIVPAGLRAAAWLVAPVAGEVDDRWATVPAPEATVALAWQGLLRDLAAGRPTSRRPARRTALTARADIVGVSREDLAPETALDVLAGCLHEGATMLLTDGASGGLQARVRHGRLDGLRRYPAEAAAKVEDPTGAGDVFLAAYLAALIAGPAAEARFGTRSALRLAALAASAVVQRPGLLGVPTAAEIADRVRPTAAAPDAGPGAPVGAPRPDDRPPFGG